jgi:hypothetical protein
MATKPKRASSAEDAGLRDWLGELRRLADTESRAPWLIGDLLVQGIERYGDAKYKDAAKATGKTVGSLRSLAWVARTYPPSERRSGLSWRHHRAAAKLQRPERREWLRRAAHWNLTSDQLAKAIADDLRAGEAPPEGWDKPPIADTDYCCPSCGYAWNGDPRPPRMERAA